MFCRWETGNNIIAQEEGYIKDLGPDPDAAGQNLNAQVQQGSYTYTSPEGQVITVNYIADEKGFHPSGDHLPTPPPVSPEVQKGLDLIYAGIRAQQVIFSDFGFYFKLIMLCCRKKTRENLARGQDKEMTRLRRILTDSIDNNSLGNIL